MSPDLFQPRNLNLTGRWQVLHRVERSSLSRYIGLEIEFDVVMTQTGDKVTGTGEKFIVGWELARREELSRLTLDGCADNANIQLSIVELSPAHPDRKMVGEVIWKAVTADMLIGSFRVDAAGSSGSSRAIRREPVLEQFIKTIV